jgi:hypothetical protein
LLTVIGTFVIFVCALNKCKEKLSSLGWPVTADVASAMGVPMVPVRDAKRAEAISGNCMHLSSSTVILFVALCCFGPR